MIKEIKVPVYYTEDDNGNKIIDTDGMESEFDYALKEVVKQTEEENKANAKN